MRFAALFAGLIVTIPYVLAATLPTPSNKTGLSSTLSDSFKTPHIRSVDGINCSAVAPTDLWDIPEQEFMDDINGLAKGYSREDFTQYAVKYAGGYWAYNWLIVHTAHTITFDEGTQSRHFHVERPAGMFGRTHGYELYGFQSGTIVLTGDGGYINWAFTEANIASNVVDDERKTHTIVFRQPEILPAC